jgi:hypothetical protein
MSALETHFSLLDEDKMPKVDEDLLQSALSCLGFSAQELRLDPAKVDAVIDYIQSETNRIRGKLPRTEFPVAINHERMNKATDGQM